MNPELSSSVALILQGHHLPHRYDAHTRPPPRAEHLKIKSTCLKQQMIFFQQGLDGEGGPEYSQDAGLPALPAQLLLSGVFCKVI